MNRGYGSDHDSDRKPYDVEHVSAELYCVLCGEDVPIVATDSPLRYEDWKTRTICCKEMRIERTREQD